VDLRDYLNMLRRNWLLVVLVLVGTLALAGVYLGKATPMYQSQTQLFVSTQASTSDNAFSGSQFATQRVASYADLATGPDVAKSVIDELGLLDTPEELAARVTAQSVPETVLLTLGVKDSDPRQAQKIAREYAVQLTDLIAQLETPPGEDTPLLKATTVKTATLADAAVSPNKLRTLGLALVLGLMLGFGIAVLRELLDTTVKTSEDLAEATEAPVLGWIHNDPIVPKQPLVTDLSPHHPRAESFRVLRTNLQFVDVDAQDKAFVVTSALSGEGKSSTAVNTALALAQAGQKVLLVDADLRRPRAGLLLGVDEAVGLTTVLSRKVTADEVTQQHESGLAVISAGPVPPNPAELLQSQAMSDFVAKVRTQYDVVVFDAPPLLPVADAAILASKTDGAIVVTRHGKTTRDQLSDAVDRLGQVGSHPLGLVFNRVPRKKAGSAYGYGYGYGYAPAAEPEAPKKGKSGKRAKKQNAGV
jgi:capsular exopolysaccharide synthesis family protein